MGQSIAEDDLVAFEPMPVPDTFVTGMLPVEDLAGLMRVTLYADRSDGSGGLERMIVARLVLARSTFVDCLFISERAVSGDSKRRASFEH